MTTQLTINLPDEIYHRVQQLAARSNRIDRTAKCMSSYIPEEVKAKVRKEENGAYIVGITACGRASIEALQLNNKIAVAVRKAWVSAGWHPPEGE